MSPGIVYEDVYYFERNQLRKGFFSVGVWEDEVVRVDPRYKKYLGWTIENLLKEFEKRNYQLIEMI